MPNEKKDTKRSSSMQSVVETNVALAKELADETQKE
jgi:hypothetical protein